MSPATIWCTRTPLSPYSMRQAWQSRANATVHSDPTMFDFQVLTWCLYVLSVPPNISISQAGLPACLPAKTRFRFSFLRAWLSNNIPNIGQRSILFHAKYACSLYSTSDSRTPGKTACAGSRWAVSAKLLWCAISPAHVTSEGFLCF